VGSCAGALKRKKQKRSHLILICVRLCHEYVFFTELTIWGKVMPQLVPTETTLKSNSWVRHQQGWHQNGQPPAQVGVASKLGWRQWMQLRTPEALFVPKIPSVDLHNCVQPRGHIAIKINSFTKG
jgi:hypothetical protein